MTAGEATSNDRPVVSIAQIDVRPRTVDWDFVLRTLRRSRFWKFRRLEPLSPTQKRRFAKLMAATRRAKHTGASIADQHRHALNRLRNLVTPGRQGPLIVVTRTRLPGHWFKITDARQIGLITTNRWASEYSPPETEVFLLKEIVGFCLLFSRRSGRGTFQHDKTRGCLFDLCLNKIEVRAGLWGDLCSECRSRLRTAGVSRIKQDEGLALIRSAIGRGRQKEVARLRKPKVFLSYARRNLDEAQAIRAGLVEAGYEVWMDVHRLRAGERWKEKIRSEIRDSDLVVLCLSKAASGKRGFFQAELWEALDETKERPLGTPYIVPIRLDDCAMPAGLKELHCPRVTPGAENGLELLLAAVEAHGPAL